ncbi:MAG TPA: bifunctional UDP-sugar hydrolase/5'-nucleotidase [Myxococcaceae bacterium]|nr:bifunctional UDP-sugar hydrolase/5'-nucleotidase [Myxococcaceae bacterium]
MRLTIVGTNDFHGHVLPNRAVLRDGTAVEMGGSAIFAGYLANVRAENPGGVILLDGGDLLHGTIASNSTEGALVVDVYNYLGYTAAAIGNHEFDYGPVGPVSVAEPGMDPFGALKARIQQAKFPLLAVNIYDAATGELPAWLGNDGTLLIEVNGVKVGIFGLATPMTPRTTNPVNVASLRFGSLAPEAISAATALRGRGAEVVIAVMHAGGKCPAYDNPRDISSCSQDEELFEMLEEIPPGTLDAIVAGHTHQPVGHFIKAIPVIETPGLGAFLSTIDLWLDPRQHSVLADRTQIRAMIPICDRVDEQGSCDPRKLRDGPSVPLKQATFLNRPVVPDAKVTEMLKPAEAKARAEQERKLGIKVPRELVRNREGESALGEVLVDALREMEGADVALINPGGLRADLPAGELTYGEVYDVLPFENTVANVTVTGEELTRLLQVAYGARRGVYQVSGLQLTLLRCSDIVRLKSVKLSDGASIRAEKRYRVAMPDFLASGGDGMAPAVSSLPPGRIDLGTNRELGFRDSLVAFIEKHRRELVAPKPGRLTLVEDPHQCQSPGS